jgi:hypothetical protein
MEEIKGKIETRKPNEIGARLSETKETVSGQVTNKHLGTIRVGSVVSVPYGQQATVINSGSEKNAILDFEIPAGPQGEMGPRGFKGDKGEQGVQGEQGEQGIKGDKGDVGPQGPAGEQGPVGPQGEQGIEGPVGPQGIQGPIGPMGPQGEKGDKGDTPDISNLATKEELNTKQDTIDDLDDIRDGASKGETAVQPEQLSAVATSGNYADLNGKPTIGNARITLRQGGVSKGSFTLNQTTAQTIDLDAGGGTGDYLPLTGGTLSGDLAVNNTFLVGKKSGYVRVAYVDMPAGGYVNSGYYGNLDSEIMFVGSAQASSPIIQFAGSITNTAAAIAINAGITQDTNTRFGNKYVTNKSRLQVGQKVTIISNKSSYTIVDDTDAVLYTGTFNTSSAFTTATPMLVGKADGSSNSVAKRVYSFVAVENGVQKVALYPAKRVLDGVVGLYDVVSNTFLTNIGTGTFTAGAEIQDEISFPTEYLVGNSLTDAIIFSDNGVELKKEYNKDDDSYKVANTKYVRDNLSSKYDKAGGVVYGDIYGNKEIHSQDVLSMGVKNDGTAVSGVTIYDKVQHTSFATASTSSSYTGPRIETGLSCKTTTKVILSYKPLTTQYLITASATMFFLNDNQRILWEYGDGEVQTIVLQSEYNDSDIIKIGGATESYELYSVVILEGTKCVAHFVPAIQGTTKGMYDLQRKTFYRWAYGNSSATNVTYGTTVNPVGSYSIGTVSDVGLNFMTNGENRLLIGNDGVVRLNQEVSSTATGKEVVTAEWVKQQGYLTEHQDISGLATKAYVDGLVGDIETALHNINSGG